MSPLCAIGLVARAGRRRLLDDVHLALRPGEVTVLVGENGAGKTTLLDHLAGVRRPSVGRVLLGGTPLHSLAPRERAQRIASLAQHPPTPGDLAALARIAQGLAPRRGFGALIDEETTRRAMAVAEELGVGHLLHRPLGALSGGELRRVHLARALVDERADAYLLDEPHAGVDVRHQPLVSRALRRRAERGAVVVASVHDLSVALDLADRVVGIRDGRIVVHGPPEEALSTEGIRAVFGVEGELVRLPSGARGVVFHNNLTRPRA